MKKTWTIAGFALALASIELGAGHAAAAGSAVTRTATTAACPVQSGASPVSGSGIVAFAEGYLGAPFMRSGSNPETGFSDLGFVRYVYRCEGVALPSTRRAMYAAAAHLHQGSLQPGDIVYFKNTIRAGLSHVGIYIGSGKFIHAEWYNRGVTITAIVNDPIDGTYWARKLIGGTRPLALSSGSL